MWNIYFSDSNDPACKGNSQENGETYFISPGWPPLSMECFFKYICPRRCYTYTRPFPIFLSILSALGSFLLEPILL